MWLPNSASEEGGGRGQLYSHVIVKCPRAGPCPFLHPSLSQQKAGFRGRVQKDRKQTFTFFGAGAVGQVPLVVVGLRCGVSPPLLEPSQILFSVASSVSHRSQTLGNWRGRGRGLFCAAPLTPEQRPSPLTTPNNSADLRTTVIRLSDATEETERRVVQTLLLILC